MNKITADIIDAIKCAERILVCGHVRPDGDCIGAALAMRHICENLGKTADAVCDADKLKSFLFLPEYNEFGNSRYEYYDLFIAVDCASDKRLGIYRDSLLDAENSINIDHHPTNNGFCAINHIDESASSTCAILYNIFSETNLIDKVAATFLYVGVSTDTGHFMHSNTTADVFGIAAKLCGYGIDVGKLNRSIYCNNSLQRIKLTARALDTIKPYCDGQIALMTILLSDLDICGCTSEDTEGLIDYVSGISGVKISIAMCEQPGGYFRVSFRAVSANVAAVAETFGGGGHKLASGCIISGTCAEVTERITAAASAALREQK